MTPSNIDYEALKFWLQVANLAWTVILSFLVFFANRHKVTQDKIDAVQARSTRGLEKVHLRVDDHERRLNCIETELRNVSDASDEIGDLASMVSEVKGRLDGIARAVDLMNEHLMNRGKS